ncbi:MAG TPA: adenylate/guanylate cyclase domain-containing protein, partial [Chloroflexi bacterium]|nr:adenylate/guanylate cyclase domain-containing protein [Chloroflexota bacterium]
MPALLPAYIPYHVRQELIAHPERSPLAQARRFDAVALFADVSGFTAISEALGASGKTGTEELTHILNAYFEPMISLIQSYGGIIGKFGGDAMTVLFPCASDLHDDPGAARRALQCALDMQAQMGNYAALTTSAGVFTLAMKAG